MAAGVPDVDVDVVAGSVGGGCSVDGCCSVGDVLLGQRAEVGIAADDAVAFVVMHVYFGTAFVNRPTIGP